MTAPSSDGSRWTPSSVEGRWAGLGPYYAMFPVEFVRKTIEALCPAGGKIIDPFCGRGTVPFVAQVTGRPALASDINPVAWLYAQVKLSPFPTQAEVLERIKDLVASVGENDCQPENDFQELAWHRNVLGFLRCARASLDWKTDSLDRTVMALILVHLHAKLGQGLSNQLRQSKAMAPAYSVRWWKSKGLMPPEIDLVDFFSKRLSWRYAKGIPPAASAATLHLGDAREVFKEIKQYDADLILTSPPYYGVTNYEYDNWIRFWMLGGPSLPSHRHESRYENKEKYRLLLLEAFTESRRLAKDDASCYVRTDSRSFTLETTLATLQESWPNRDIYFRFDRAQGPTQTALFNKKWHKAGEVDFLLLPQGKSAPLGFYTARGESVSVLTQWHADAANDPCAEAGHFDLSALSSSTSVPA